jgi:hypothetical protein
MTQYLQYKADEKRLRYATDIDPSELLDYDGDVAVSISLSQFWTDDKDASTNASQFRVDTTQVHPYMNIIAPLAWTAIASLMPDKAGKVPSLEELGFTSDESTAASKKVLLNGGLGKLAVNISRAAKTSIFIKALNLMMQGAKMAAPLVTLPAVSVPALSAFTSVLSYYEARNQFIMSGNLIHAVATQPAMKDPELRDPHIGLVSGDYLMVPQKSTDLLKTLLPHLDLIQGYLVRKDADSNVPLKTRAQNAVEGITYASMKVSVAALQASEKAPASPGVPANPQTKPKVPSKSGSNKP